MGGFDSMKDQASVLLGEHGDKAEQGVDKAAEFVDEKTGGKYGEQIDAGAERASEGLSSFGQDGEGQDKGGGGDGQGNS